MTETHQQTIATEFTKQAQSFGQQGLTLSSAELLAWAVDNLPLKPASTVLDIATGTGHLARAVAPHVDRVTGIDATPAMLAQCIAAAHEESIDNLHLVHGLAEALPFANESFDLTVCRLAIHHYQRPSRHVAEMIRTCKVGGSVAIIDLVAPDKVELAEQYNHYERLRDPSHTTALAIDGLIALLETQRVPIEHVTPRSVTVAVGPWLTLTRTPSEQADIIREALRTELNGGTATGMEPFFRDDILHFSQRWVVVSGRKRGR